MANDMDEVYERRFVGNENAARDVDLPKKHEIRHIVSLNGSEGSAYFPEQFKYGIMNLNDSEFEELCQEFWKALNFVKEAIEKGGAPFIHCRRGISRSGALGLAYMIEEKGMKFEGHSRS
jgi:predicted protein tyrosine phosphatase